LLQNTSLTESFEEKLIAGIKVLLKDLKIVKENEVGQKTLAYKINRETSGYYFDFSLEGENVPADFEKSFWKNDNILRHFIIENEISIWARSLNKVQLIGNLTRDPELRYTPNGTAVCSFGLQQNRSWKTDTGEKHDEAEFHNIVAWNKLAELVRKFFGQRQKSFIFDRKDWRPRTWTGTRRSFQKQDGE